MNRKMYQIVELSETLMHAGSKATSDVTKILSQMGVESLEIMTVSRSKNPIKKSNSLVELLKSMEKSLPKN